MSKSDALLGERRMPSRSRKTKPTLPAFLAGGIRERFRFLICQLTLSPAPRRTHLFVPRNSKTKSSKTPQIRHGCLKAIDINSNRPTDQLASANLGPLTPRYRLSS